MGVHECGKERELGEITQKQRNRDDQYKALVEAQNETNKMLRDFINKVDERYVSKEVFDIHKVESKGLSDKVDGLIRFREYIMIKIGIVSGATSMISFIGYEYLIKIIK